MYYRTCVNFMESEFPISMHINQILFSEYVALNQSTKRY